MCLLVLVASLALMVVGLLSEPRRHHSYFIIEHPTRGTLREVDSDPRGHTSYHFSWSGMRNDPAKAMRFLTFDGALNVIRAMPRGTMKDGCTIRKSPETPAAEWEVVYRRDPNGKVKRRQPTRPVSREQHTVPESMNLRARRRGLLEQLHKFEWEWDREPSAANTVVLKGLRERLSELERRIWHIETAAHRLEEATLEEE